MAKAKTKKQLFTDLITADGYKAYEVVDGIVMWNEPYRFKDEHNSFRPRCINPGCVDPVAICRGTKDTIKGRDIRTVCTQCHLASYGEKPLRDGITPYKKTYCENNDSHLGFVCTTTIHYPGVLELDHIDGNHFNNIPSNVETLCKVCHAYKSHISGNFKKSPKVQREMGFPPESISLPAQHSLF